MKRVATSLAVLLAVVISMINVLAQDPPPAGGQDQPTGGRQGGQGQQPPVIRPYDRVITKEAKTTEGVFSVHRLGERIYYEIPKSELGKEFLWVSQIAKTTYGAGYGGQEVGNRVVKWERHNNRVLLKSVRYQMVADPKQPIARAVEAANNDTILMSFNIEALNKDDAPVIDVTRLFTSEVTEFSARQSLRARGFDASRTFVERVVSFPQNIEVEVTQTYTSPPDAAGAGGGGGPQLPGGQQPGMAPGSATILMHYSMVKLPENPMMPRVFDERVGYFSVRQLDYGRDEHRSPRRVYITRWRLEKKDPNAARFRAGQADYLLRGSGHAGQVGGFHQRGIEKWQPAFEAAGFQERDHRQRSADAGAGSELEP